VFRCSFLFITDFIRISNKHSDYLNITFLPYVIKEAPHLREIFAFLGAPFYEKCTLFRTLVIILLKFLYSFVIKVTHSVTLFTKETNRLSSGKKKRKSNCNVNEKEVIKIIAEYKEVSILVAISKRRKSNCSGLTKT
jgi:hypothetical protein